jgi:hypothetical protein
MSNNAKYIEQALSIGAAVAGCVAPPWGGAFAVGAILTAEDLLRDFFPGTSPSAPPTFQQIVESVSTAVSQQFAQHDIQTALDQIRLVHRTLLHHMASHQPLPKSIDGALTKHPESPFSDLYTFLHTQVTGGDNPTDTLVGIIESMMRPTEGDISLIDGNLQAAFLPTFVSGVNTYQLLAVYWARLIAAVEPDAKTNLSMALANLNGWIDYFPKAFQAYLDAVDNRLKQVGGVLLYDADYVLNRVTGIYFSDHGTAVQGFHPETLLFEGTYRGGQPLRGQFPGSLGDDATPLPDDATAVVFAQRIAGPFAEEDYAADWVRVGNDLRNRYIDLMQRTLHENYFNPDDLKVAASYWSNGVEKLKTVLAMAPS